MFGRRGVGTRRHARRVDAKEWARAHGATGEPELVSDEPWSTVWRTPDGLWLKKPKGRWRFEVPLTVALASRWPDRVPGVVEHGDDWLVTRDAGMRIGADRPPSL